MILIDSNIPMYLVGAAHPNKDAARRLIEASIDAGERLVTDAEVFQEILHRYVAINRRDAIGPAFEALSGLVDQTFAIDVDLVGRARSLVQNHDGLSARDAMHVAVMQREGIPTVMSFDRGFDEVPGIRWLGVPVRVRPTPRRPSPATSHPPSVRLATTLGVVTPAVGPAGSRGRP